MEMYTLCPVALHTLPPARPLHGQFVPLNTLDDRYTALINGSVDAVIKGGGVDRQKPARWLGARLRRRPPLLLPLLLLPPPLLLPLLLL